MSATPATKTAAEEVMQIIIDLHAAVDARIKVCPVLVLAAGFILSTLGSLRDGLAALVGRVPGRPSPRRRKRRPPPPTPTADAGSPSAATAATASDGAAGADPAGAMSPGSISPGATAATTGNASDAKPRLRKPRRWPSKYRAIADLIGDDAAAIAARLRALLADPEAIAYIRANPEFARLLRPLCRGFRVRLIPELRRKPAFRLDEIEPFEETPPVEPEPPSPPELPSPIESIADPAPEPPPAPPPAPQPSPVPPPQPPMYGIGPPDWTPTDPGPSMKERVDRWLARQRAMGLI